MDHNEKTDILNGANKLLAKSMLCNCVATWLMGGAYITSNILAGPVDVTCVSNHTHINSTTGTPLERVQMISSLGLMFTAAIAAVLPPLAIRMGNKDIQTALSLHDSMAKDNVQSPRHRILKTPFLTDEVGPYNNNKDERTEVSSNHSSIVIN